MSEKIYLTPFIEVSYITDHKAYVRRLFNHKIYNNADWVQIFKNADGRVHFRYMDKHYITYVDDPKCFIYSINKTKKYVDQKLIEEGYILLTEEQYEKMAILI